jgi:gluconokinase
MAGADNTRGVAVGLDLGTTGIKATAFDVDGQPIASAERPAGLQRDADGAATLDPERVAGATEEALAEVAEATQRQGCAIRRLGFSAAMHSLIPIGLDGAPLAPAMTWADLRPQPDAEALWRSPAGRDIYTRTGTPIHAMSPLAKLLWLRRAQPELFQRATMFVGLKEWLWRRWFGEWVIDASLASATGLYNLRAGQWDRDALALADITPDRLPRIVPTTYARSDLAPDIARHLGLDGAPLIATGASDGTLANLGVGALDSRWLVVTIGTSLAVRRGVAEPVTDPATRIFCYALGPDRFVSGAASNNGGGVLQWMYQRLLTHWPGDAQPDGLAAALEEASHAHADGLIFLPYIAGERAPLWSGDTSGALVGLRAEHTAADALRAAVEGILFNAAWLMEQVVGGRAAPEAVVATGGAFQSGWVAQLAADILGLPLISAGAVFASARGAALVADIAAGARTWEQAQEVGATELAAAPRIEPRPNEMARYQERYQRFRALAAALEKGAG